MTRDWVAEPATNWGEMKSAMSAQIAADQDLGRAVRSGGPLNLRDIHRTECEDGARMVFGNEKFEVELTLNEVDPALFDLLAGGYPAVIEDPEMTALKTRERELRRQLGIEVARRTAMQEALEAFLRNIGHQP